MGYTVVRTQEGFGPRRGLEGPFFYENGMVLYYDPREGKYWDPRTDWYLENSEVTQLNNSVTTTHQSLRKHK